jgi:hypothetical protein
VFIFFYTTLRLTRDQTQKALSITAIVNLILLTLCYRVYNLVPVSSSTLSRPALACNCVISFYTTLRLTRYLLHNQTQKALSISNPSSSLSTSPSKSLLSSFYLVLVSSSTLFRSCPCIQLRVHILLHHTQVTDTHLHGTLLSTPADCLLVAPHLARCCLLESM